MHSPDDGLDREQQFTSQIGALCQLSRWIPECVNECNALIRQMNS
jgi:hypothetical protein